ncbi:hypothetical protein D3C81_239430 [compost metagenome]
MYGRLGGCYNFTFAEQKRAANRMVVEFLVELPNPLLALQFVCTLSIISLIFSHDELDCNQMTIGETPCDPPSRRPVTSDDE